MSTTLNTMSDVTNSSPDAQLDKAFNDIVQQYEEHGTITLPTSNDSSNEDSFETKKPEEESSATGDEVTQQSQLDATSNESQGQPVGQQTPDNKVTDDFILDNGMSVQQLKEELHKKDMDIKLQHSRLNELSAQYQELKAFMELQNSKNFNANQVQQDSSKATKSEAVKELFDLYPEIAEAVTQMIDEKTSATAKTFEETLNQRVIPIQQHLQQSATQQFVNKVTAAHPDASDIIKSQALRTWVESLDPIMRSGAHTIMQYGNADDVISLLNQFKTATNRGMAYSQGTSLSSSTTNGNGLKASSSNSSAHEDAIARKVLAMLNLPSNTQEPTIVSQQQVPVYKNVDEAFMALAKEYEANQKR